MHRDNLTTTLNAIRAHSPCEDGWRKVLKHLGKTQADDEPLPLLTILDSNGLDDCLWCLRAVDDVDSFARHFAVDCAERVRHLMADERSTAALEVARRHANGLASDSELKAARKTIGGTAWDATWDAAWDAAWGTAWSAARDAARDAERQWQTDHLRGALLDPAAYLKSKREVTA